MAEYWDAYDEKGHLLPEITLERSRFPYAEGYYHLAVNVWVRHEDGQWLFVRRSSSKCHYPSYYEEGAGGSVLKGESSLEAARRELLEETGLVADEVDYLFSFTEAVHQTHFETYLANVSGGKELRYQKGETEEHCWLREDQIKDFLTREKNL